MSRVQKARLRVFVGCEGKSEESYVAFLYRLFRDDHFIHLQAVNLNGGGHSLDLVHRAKKQIAILKRQSGKKFDRHLLLLDFDKDSHRQYDPLAIKEAEKISLTLIWQRPNFEYMLCRHFQEAAPSSPTACTRILEREMGSYAKGMSATSLARYITMSHVSNARKNDRDLATFFKLIGVD